MTRPASFWSDDLDWLLRAVNAALGLRGARLEPGSITAPSETWPAHLAHIMRGPDVRRARRLIARWVQLSTEHRHVLEVHYGSPNPPRYQDLSREKSGQATRGEWPRGSELLGDCAAVALWLAYVAARKNGEASVIREAKALTAAIEAGRYPKLEPWREKAERAVNAAHRAWDATALEQAKAWVG